MNAVHDILQQIPMDQLAGQLGTDPATATAAAEVLIPTLIQGMQSNAETPDGAAALAGALQDHAGSDLLVGGLGSIDDVDTTDGSKIVSHIFGGQTEAAQAAGGLVSNDLVRKLLPILAPIVMAYLAQQLTKGGQGGILGDLLNGALGGGQQRQTQQTPSGGDLGSILGSILGGAMGGQQAPQTMPNQPQMNPPATGSATDMRIDEEAPQAQQSSGGGLFDTIKDVLTGKKS